MAALQNRELKPAIQTWLNQNERCIKDTSKAKEKQWFNGIFVETKK